MVKGDDSAGDLNHTTDRTRRGKRPHRVLTTMPIEREFGVPFPGTILPPDGWTQTALKRYPEGGLRWPELFGRTAPVVLDLGCGNGRFLIGSALTRPDHDHLGVDTLPVVVRYARKRANQRGLTNIKFAVGGGPGCLAKNSGGPPAAENPSSPPPPTSNPPPAPPHPFPPPFLPPVPRGLGPGGPFSSQ